MRLLIVEDEPAIADLLERVARKLGVETLAVHGAQPFRAAFLQFAPDAVWMDVYLEGDEDGIDLMDWLIRKDFDGSIVVMSGAADYLSAATLKTRELRWPGSLHTLMKPMSLALIKETLRELQQAA